MTNSKVSITRNVLYNWLRVGLSLVFPLITTPYLTRVLGTEGIGKVNYIYSITSYFAAFATLGISDYAIKEGGKIRDDPEKLGKFATEMFILNLIATGLASVAFFSLLFIPSLNVYSTLIIIMYIHIPAGALGLLWIFQVFEDYKRITLFSTVIQLISVALMFILVRSKDDYLNYAFVHVFSSVSVNFICFFSIRKQLKLFGYGNYELIKHLKPILIIFALGIAASLYLNFDTTMLGTMIGDDSVGLYYISVKLVNMVEKIMTSISGVLLARLSYYVGSAKTREFDDLVKKTISCILIIAIPAAIGLFCLAEPTVLLIGGPGFLLSARSLRVLCFKIVFSTLNGFLVYQILLPLNKEKISALATIISCVVNLGLNYLIIPVLEETGAAITTVLAELCVFIICIYAARSVIKRISLWGTIFKLFLAAIQIPIVSVIVFKLTDSILLRLVIPIGLCVPMYFGLLYLLKEPVVMYYTNRVFKKLSPQNDL